MNITEYMTPAGLEMVRRVMSGKGTHDDVQSLAGLCALMYPGHDNWGSWRELMGECRQIVHIKQMRYAKYGRELIYFLGGADEPEICRAQAED